MRRRPQRQAGLMGVAYAVTLPFSGILTAWFLASVAPKILRVDLPKVSKELEAKMGTHEDVGEQAYQPVVARAYRLANAALAGRTPRELAAALQGAVVTRFRQGAQIIDADVQTAIPQGATLVLSGSPHALFAAKETDRPGSGGQRAARVSGRGAGHRRHEQEGRGPDGAGAGAAGARRVTAVACSSCASRVAASRSRQPRTSRSNAGTC